MLHDPLSKDTIVAPTYHKALLDSYLRSMAALGLFSPWQQIYIIQTYFHLILSSYQYDPKFCLETGKQYLLNGKRLILKYRSMCSKMLSCSRISITIQTYFVEVCPRFISSLLKILRNKQQQDKNVDILSSYLNNYRAHDIANRSLIVTALFEALERFFK